jgi:glutamate/tyrosine decarboxylase-like PLP-dependent enzyme
MKFPSETAKSLSESLCAQIEDIYAPASPIPTDLPTLPDLPDEGRGYGALPDLWSLVAAGSTRLASPLMMGHMDTAPHPVAALSDAVVSALNNNLLFREISPIASQIEEDLVTLFIERLGLGGDWGGTFASGGSLANLTALFAACGGFAELGGRDRVRVYVTDSIHASVKKSAAVLGMTSSQVVIVPSDETGRMHPDALESVLNDNRGCQNIVVGVLGSTIHGVVDPLDALGVIAHKHGAWFHVDAIYGGVLAFSNRNRKFLKGIDRADSVVLGPQKWMYVPRLSALVLIKGQDKFDKSLGVDLPYSATGEQHRGKWGLQGSRRADAVTLWLTLQTVGLKGVGEMADKGIVLTQEFHDLLRADDTFQPTHAPDLNLQCFKPQRDLGEKAMSKIHRDLTEAGGPWVSLSRWRDELLFRSVILSPDTGIAELQKLLQSLTPLVSRVL